MNYNISFSSFQETGQTGTTHLLNLVQSTDNTALNKQDDQVTLFTLQFHLSDLGELPEHFELGFSSTENPWIWLVIPIFSDS